MRSIREVLRLKYGLGRSHRQIATALGICNSTVSLYVSRAAEAGLSWPLPEGLDDNGARGRALHTGGKKTYEHQVAMPLNGKVCDID